MSTAIFLTPRRNGGGFDVQVGEDGARLADGVHNLVVFDSHGRTLWGTPMSEGDWEHLQHCIDRLLHQARSR